MSVRLVLVACSLSLLASGVSSAAQPPPDLEELWRSYPLDPTATTPGTTPPESTLPAFLPGPVEPDVVADEEGDAGSPLSGPVLGGLVGAVAFIVVGGFVLTRRRRHRRKVDRPLPSLSGLSHRQLIEEAFTLAREAAECDKVLYRQRTEGVAVSESPGQASEYLDQAPAEAEVGDASQRRGETNPYAELGERVAGVLSAAEAAAERMRADARLEADELLERAQVEVERVRSEAAAYDTDTRAAVESYATERRRQADLEERKLLSEAEAQARATREAAEEMARDIEAAANQRGQALREEYRSVEERLQRAVLGLRRMSTQLEELLGSDVADESLADALKPSAREGQREPLVQRVHDASS